MLPEVGTARKAGPEGPSITEPAESWPVVDERILHGYEEVIQKDPQDHATRWKLAQAYASLGNHAAALEQGEELVQRGEFVDEVITYLEQTAGTGAKTRRVYQLLGDAYFKTDRLDKAVDAYRKALTLLQ